MSQSQTLSAQRKAWPGADKAQTGAWYGVDGHFDEFLGCAEENGLPVFVLWSNGEGCSNCEAVEAGLNEGVWKNWMAGSGVMFYAALGFDIDKDVKENHSNGKVRLWCEDNGGSNMFPYIRLKWNNSLKTANGLEATGYLSTSAAQGKGPEIAEDVVDWCKSALESWGYAPTEPARTYHTVAFVDWDGTILTPAQQVLDGTDAVPPPDPARQGYTFDYWRPSYQNVVKDLTCIAQYKYARGDLPAPDTPDEPAPTPTPTPTPTPSEHYGRVRVIEKICKETTIYQY